MRNPNLHKFCNPKWEHVYFERLRSLLVKNRIKVTTERSVHKHVSQKKMFSTF